jgi:hypothetical protein
VAGLLDSLRPILLGHLRGHRPVVHDFAADHPVKYMIGIVELAVHRVLYRGCQAIALLQGPAHHTLDAFLEFRDTSAALDFLRPCLDDPLSLGILREVLAEELACADIAGLDNHEVLAELAWRLVGGHVRVAPFTTSRPAVQAGVAGRVIAPEVGEEGEPVAPVAVEQRTAWIAVELVDEEGNPVAGETYQLQLPDGSMRVGQLDANGQARVEGIEPGMCRVSFPHLRTQGGATDTSRGGTG